MKSLQFRCIEEAVKFIHGAGCLYNIQAPSGESWVNGLEVKPAKQKAPRKKSEFPHGEVSNFVRPQIDLTQAPGEERKVLIGKYGAKRVQTTLNEVLTKAWGKGSYRSERDGDVVVFVRHF
jgi:hypothetical protein